MSFSVGLSPASSIENSQHVYFFHLCRFNIDIADLEFSASTVSSISPSFEIVIDACSNAGRTSQIKAS
jgi:hypothetical protein